MSALQPVGNRVLVRPEKAATVIGGIHVPETSNSRTGEVRRGKIVAVGAGVEEKGLLTVGVRVLFAPFGGTPVKGDDNEELHLVGVEDILGVLA